MSNYASTVTPVGTANIPARRMDFEFDDAIPNIGLTITLY